MGRATRPQGGGGARRASKGESRAKKVEGEIVDRLLEMAESSGEMPWQRPWNLMAAVHNGISGYQYRGINIFYLSAVANQRGYNSSRWMTYKQAEEESFQQWRRQAELPDNEETRQQYEAADAYRGVRKGETGTRIVVYAPVERRDKNNKPVLRADGTPDVFFRPFYHNVFNAEQTDLEFPPEEDGARANSTPIESAERIVENFPGAPPIEHGGDRAFYVPSQDRIQLPPRERFRSDEEYYKTLFHEMIHATGHSSRTNRTQGDWSGMGSESYAEEELVAEIGAAMLAARAGLDEDEMRVENSAAYLKSWMKRLRDDPELLPRAAARAQTAVDYILGVEETSAAEKAAA